MSLNYAMKPHDIVVISKILVSRADISVQFLSENLFMTAEEITASLERLGFARLITNDPKFILKKTFFEFIVFGLKVVFPAKPGEIVNGIPTAHSSPVLGKYFVFDTNYVWPDQESPSRGLAVSPFYDNQTKAVLIDEKLYQILSLIETFRVGRNREKAIAFQLLTELLEIEYANPYS